MTQGSANPVQAIDREREDRCACLHKFMYLCIEICTLGDACPLHDEPPLMHRTPASPVQSNVPCPITSRSHPSWATWGLVLTPSHHELVNVLHPDVELTASESVPMVTRVAPPATPNDATVSLCLRSVDTYKYWLDHLLSFQPASMSTRYTRVPLGLVNELICKSDSFAAAAVLTVAMLPMAAALGVYCSGNWMALTHTRPSESVCVKALNAPVEGNRN